MLKAINQISECLLHVQSELTELQNSLQKEFEFFAGSERQNEIILKSKTRQIKSLEFVIEQLEISLKELLELPFHALKPEAEPKYSDKPILGIEKLRQLAKDKPGELKQVVKNIDDIIQKKLTKITHK